MPRFFGLPANPLSLPTITRHSLSEGGLTSTLSRLGIWNLKNWNLYYEHHQSCIQRFYQIAPERDR